MLYNYPLIENIKDILKERGQTLSVAESVTSGHLQAAFSAAQMASTFFQGGITVYNAGQKCRHLNVEPIDALEKNCVTEKVAREMALHVTKLFLSDYGIAITGYAVRMPERKINDLYAFFAIADKEKIIVCKKITTNKEEGVQAQVDYANQVIKAFDKYLQKEKSR